MTAVIIDCETTGLTVPRISSIDRQPYIIEFAAARIEKGKVKKKYGQLIHPGRDVTAEITKITGITNAMLKGMPSFREVLKDISKMLDGADTLFAHNAPFDVACLSYELVRGKAVEKIEDVHSLSWFPKNIVCTVQEYVHEFGYRPKMTELYEKKMKKPLLQTHRALDDVLALAEIVVAEGLA